MKYEKKTQSIVFMLILVTMGFFPCHGSASSTVTLLKGQSVYVPIYSHIYHGDRDKPFDLTATFSICNTDPKHKIIINSADYYDSEENLLKNYVEQPIKLKNLDSVRYIIESKDKIE